MAALGITAANIVSGAIVITETGIAGEAIAVGEAVYKLSTDSELYLAQANAAATDDVFGIALHVATDGQQLSVLREGQLTINAVATPGVVYCLDDAVAGAIIPWADLSADSSDYLTIIGPAISTTVIDVNIQTTGIVLPAI